MNAAELSQRFPDFVTGVPFDDKICIEQRLVRKLENGKYEWTQNSWAEERPFTAGICSRCRKAFPDRPYLIRLRGEEYRLCSKACFDNQFEITKRTFG